MGGCLSRNSAELPQVSPIREEALPACYWLSQICSISVSRAPLYKIRQEFEPTIDATYRAAGPGLAPLHRACLDGSHIEVRDILRGISSSEITKSRLVQSIGVPPLAKACICRVNTGSIPAGIVILTVSESSLAPHCPPDIASRCINAPAGTSGWTPLHCAVASGNVQAVSLLLDHGALLNPGGSKHGNPCSTSTPLVSTTPYALTGVLGADC